MWVRGLLILFSMFLFCVEVSATPFEGRLHRVMIRCRDADGHLLSVTDSRPDSPMIVEFQDGQYRQWISQPECTGMGESEGTYSIVKSDPLTVQMQKTREAGCSTWRGMAGMNHVFRVEGPYLVEAVQHICHNDHPDSITEWVYAFTGY